MTTAPTQKDERQPALLKVLISDCGCGCGGALCTCHQPRVEPPCDGECGCTLRRVDD